MKHGTSIAALAASAAFALSGGFALAQTPQPGAEQPAATADMPADDAAIASEVQATLSSLDGAGDVQASVQDGLVILSGSADSEETMDQINEAVKGVAGVQAVDATGVQLGQ